MNAPGRTRRSALVVFLASSTTEKQRGRVPRAVALGVRRKPCKAPALKGCKEGLLAAGAVRLVQGLVRPYRAEMNGGAWNPGRCPGLPWAAPLGLRKKPDNQLLHPGSIAIPWLPFQLAPCRDNLPQVSSQPTGDTANPSKAPTRRNGIAQGSSSPMGQTANPSEAPTGRPKVAQGNALGLSAPKYPRAEGPA